MVSPFSRGKLSLAAAILACLLAGFPAFDQTLPFEVIGLDRGLPQSQVGAVAQDARGYIWIATWGGLARFDGERFTQFYADSGLPSNRTEALLTTSSGDLWIATADGLALRSGNRMEAVKDPHVSAVRCRALAQDADGTIWVGTNQGLALKIGGAFQPLKLPMQPDSQRVYEVTPSGKGVLAVAAGGLFYCESSGKIERVAGPPAPPTSFRTALVAQGRFWLGTEGRGLWVRDGETWSPVPLGKASSVSRLYADRSGTLYICTQDAGLFLKSQGEDGFRQWSTANGLPSSVVNCVFEDREGSIWIGTDIGGLARLSDLSVNSYGVLQGLPDPCVFGIAAGPAPDSLWVSTLHGAALLEAGPLPKVRETVTSRDGLENEWIWKAVQAPSGDLWILTDQGVQVRKKGSRSAGPTPTGAAFPKGSTYDLALDSQGRIWITGDEPELGGLRMSDGKGSWKSWKTTEEGRPLPVCRVLARRRAGGIWLCTEDHRVVWCDGGGAHELTSAPPLPSKANVTAIFEDSSGRLWAGNDGGLAVMENDGRWFLMNDRPGFTSHHVFFIGEDGSGTIWVGTGRGAFRFLKDGRVTAMTPVDGLASFETNQGGFYCDPSGDVWIGTLGGLSRYRDLQHKENTTAPDLVVESAQYASKRTDFPKSLTLRWRERSVTFTVALLSFRQHSRCSYRARMEGLEEEWLPLRSTSELRYTNLPAGRHALLLQAVNESGVWGLVVRLPIRVVPPFWKTTWFTLCVALSVLVGALAIHRWRVHVLKARTEELERLVAERTRDLFEEKERSEHLLLNILPKPIAERLKRDPGVIAESFPEVTVLFADIAKFTQFSAGISPEKLVSVLNEIFSGFDRLAEKHGLEKIKTIGDAYMAVGGLPQPRQDSAVAVAEMALDMRDSFIELAGRLEIGLELRIGINTGPVVAGVIGTKKFIYDLWGDTVNLASRMEGTGVSGKIQVSESTFLRIEGKFVFGPRQIVEVKGKGPTPAYFLEGRL